MIDVSLKQWWNWTTTNMFLKRLNGTPYLVVHKPKFALVQDKALCGQKSQCSGQGFLVLLHWVSCDPWPKTSLCRSHQYQQQTSGPTEWFWLYYWFDKVIAAVSGTPPGIHNLFTRIFHYFQDVFSIIYILEPLTGMLNAYLENTRQKETRLSWQRLVLHYYL